MHSYTIKIYINAHTYTYIRTHITRGGSLAVVDARVCVCVWCVCVSVRGGSRLVQLTTTCVCVSVRGGSLTVVDALTHNLMV